MKTTKEKSSGIVYSTDHGKVCSACGYSVAQCVCRRGNAVPPNDGIVRIERSTKGRKGKGVTVITGIPLDHNGLSKLAKQLKQKCGSGGNRERRCD